MAFDVQGAIKAGYSQDDILQHLTQSRNFDIEGALKAGYSKDDVINHLSTSQSVTPTQPQPQQEDPYSSTGMKVSNFLGTTKLGQGIGQSIASNLYGNQVEQSNQQLRGTQSKVIQAAQRARARGDNATAERLLKVIQGQSGADVGDVVTNGQGFVTPRQIAGSAVSTAANVLTGGLATPERLAGRAALSGTIGAITATGQGLQDTTNNADVANQAVIAGLISALIPPVLEKGSAVVGKALTGTAEQIYKRLIKTPLPQITAGKEQIGSGLLKRGIKGNYEQMATQLEEVIKKNNQAIKDIVATNADKAVDIPQEWSRRGAVRNIINSIKSKIYKIPGREEDAAFLRGVSKTLKDRNLKELPLETAQKLKQLLQADVGTKGFLQTEAQAANKEATKTISRQIRASIEKAVPEIAEPNKEVEFGIRALQRLKATDALSPSKLRVMAELITGIAGGFYNPAITAGVIGERVLTSPRVSSSIAQKAYKVGSKQISPVAANYLRNISANLTGKITNPAQ